MRPCLAPFCTLVLLAPAALSQTHRALPKEPADTASFVPANRELPVTRVALYKNGVGFFEHAGHVTGDQAVTIDFTTAQLNDVLQSLTAIDLNGGRIIGAGYNSTTPLDQQLKTLPLALGEDPTDVDFFNAIRGARVAVTGPALAITGRLLSIDLRDAMPKKADDSATPEEERRFLTVVSDAGEVRTFELSAATHVRLLDTTLHTDVSRYLELLANSRNQGLRHLTIEDRGTGARNLLVSYISEVPVWKSTYRILFGDAKTAVAGQNQTATLQGWSVVDNTTGSDWTNVRLSLIAGAPQSFIQPLSTPYYARRPEIPLPAEAMLTPQTHESGDQAVVADKVQASDAPVDGIQITNGLSQRYYNSGAGVAVSGTAKRSSPARISGGVMGGGGSNASGVMVNRFTGGGLAPLANYDTLAQDSITPNTSAAAFDDYFEYTLTDPITIRKNESALVPILQTRVPVERVTLWSEQNQVALRALWITNSSTLTLDRGSFSIVEGGSFGGEGLLDPIHPAERRLLSYAADQAVRVSISGQENSRQIERVTIAKGLLTERSVDVSELTYDVRNAAPETRTVILEHPVRNGYTLDPGTPKPDETTPTLDRFRVLATPGQTAHLHLSERHTGFERIQLTSRSQDQLELILQNAKASPAALAALQPAFDAHNRVVALDQQISRAEDEVKTITADQARIRDNLKALNGTVEEKALASRYTGELNSQEDRLTALRAQIAQLRTQRTAADEDFQAKLQAIQFDETI